MSGDRTHRQILMAAGPVFADRGFDGATVREICQLADVNLASVNYHFGDKRRLYVEAVKFARQLREDEEPLPQWTEQTPPEEQLRMFITTFLRRLLGPQASWQMRLLTREILEPTEACREMAQESFRPFFELLLSIIVRLLPDPIARPQLEQLGFSVLSQIIYYRVHREIIEMLVGPTGDDYSIEHLAEHITSFSLSGLKASVRSGPHADQFAP